MASKAHPDRKAVKARFIPAAALVLLASAALAHDHDRFPGMTPSTEAWVKGLQSKGGVNCCSVADSWQPEEVTWDTDTGKYRVLLDGKWQDVPPEAVIDAPNRIGFAMVWTWNLDGVRQIRCFIAGAGG